MLVLALWIAGTAGATTVWWRDHPHPTPPGAVGAAGLYSLIWGGTLLQYLPRTK